MKAFTSIEQSKKLAEILPLESADMWFANGLVVAKTSEEPKDIKGVFPCWSLAALLGVLNKTAYFMDEDASINLSSYKTIEWDLGIDNSDLELVTEFNPLDACVEMISKLHKLNLL